jgi:hypothetical protein
VRVNCFLLDSFMLPHKLGLRNLEDRLDSGCGQAGGFLGAFRPTEQTAMFCSLSSVDVGADTTTMSFVAGWPPLTTSTALKIITIGCTLHLIAV